jgi:hypothetical protein
MKKQSDIDVEYLIKKGDKQLVFQEVVQEKMREKLTEVDELMKENTRYIIALFIFLAMMIIAIILSLYILWLGAIIGAMLMMFWQERCNNAITRNMGFVDGLVYSTIEVDKKFEKFKENIKEKGEKGIGEELKKMLKEIKED